MRILQQPVEYLTSQELADDTAPGAPHHGWMPVEARYSRYPLYPPCSEGEEHPVSVLWQLELP